MFLFTFTMFFSGGIIPLYLVIKSLHMYDTIWAIVLPVAVSAYNLIVCRSFFDTGIPTEMLEAARIDGCTDFKFFFRIVIPLSSTIIAVMCLFYATALWNMFFNPLMFLSGKEYAPAGGAAGFGAHEPGNLHDQQRGGDRHASETGGAA